MTAWNNQMAKELETLQDLLVELRALNKGSSFLQRTERCIALAEQLTDWNAAEGQRSFINRLTELCAETRGAALKRGQERGLNNILLYDDGTHEKLEVK